MEPQRVSPIVGMLNFLLDYSRNGLAGPDRSKAITTVIGNVTVDTCPANDTGLWETGIWRPQEGEWLIVEQYENDERAKAAHTNWVAQITSNPNMPLKDIDLWSLD